MQDIGQKSNILPEKTADEPTTELSGNGTKPEKPSSTSGRRKSTRGASGNTPLIVQLKFIQQTVFDYKTAGGEVQLIKLPRKDDESQRIAIVLAGVDISDGNFVALW